MRPRASRRRRRPASVPPSGARSAFSVAASRGLTSPPARVQRHAPAPAPFARAASVGPAGEDRRRVDEADEVNRLARVPHAPLELRERRAALRERGGRREFGHDEVPAEVGLVNGIAGLVDESERRERAEHGRRGRQRPADRAHERQRERGRDEHRPEQPAARDARRDALRKRREKREERRFLRRGRGGGGAAAARAAASRWPCGSALRATAAVRPLDIGLRELPSKKIFSSSSSVPSTPSRWRRRPPR